MGEEGGGEGKRYNIHGLVAQLIAMGAKQVFGEDDTSRPSLAAAAIAQILCDDDGGVEEAIEGEGGCCIGGIRALRHEGGGEEGSVWRGHG